MSKQYWYIVGYDSFNKIFDKKVMKNCFSENQIQALLMALTAKAGLTFNEIVGAYAKKRTRIANDLLSVKKDGPYPVYSCGSNPHFTAKVVTEDS